MKTRIEAEIRDNRRPILFANHIVKMQPANAPACITDTMFEDRFAMAVLDLSMSPYFLRTG